MSKSNSFSFPDNVTLTDDAQDDFLTLDHSLQIPVFKAICKVSANPQPQPKGYGKPLSGRLSGYCKIKLRDYGVRIIYNLVPTNSNNMNVIIIGMRSDDAVYEEATNRI